MINSFCPAHGWGPERKRGALSITFDNLGEAAELEMGMWDEPIGVHHTARFVPRLIETLGNVRATYFIEASNTALYPEAIRAWAAAGHEVGLHAWRHEVWEQCPPERRRALLTRSVMAMRALGIDPVGFRPPGGKIPVEAWTEFAAAGLLYCSELGPPGVGLINGVVSLPFAWRAVDVYMLEDMMSFMRVRRGDPEPTPGLAEWRAELEAIVAAARDENSHRTVIFHPNFIGASDEKLAAVTDLIAAARRAELWIAPAREVAAFTAASLVAPPAHAA